VRLAVAPTLSVVVGVAVAVEESEAVLDPLSEPDGD
jgi:ribonuclease PH